MSSVSVHAKQRVQRRTGGAGGGPGAPVCLHTCSECIMRTAVAVLVVWWCGAGCAWVPAARPLMFAAVPLHAPVPVLHVLSPAGALSPVHAGAAAALAPVYARPLAALDSEGSSSQEYAPASAETDEGSRESAPTVLYARPAPAGGYTYRKHRRPARRPPSSTEEPPSPVIIKVHKYKITKRFPDLF